MKRSISKMALLLALIMVIGLIAGCDTTDGTTTGTTTEPAGTTTTAAPTTSTTEGEVSNLNAPGELPVCKEMETMRMVITQSPHILSYEYGENKLTTWLQDRTNVELDFIFYPEADAQTKLNIELSTGGDLGDLILAGGTARMDRATLITFGSQGVLMDLTELLQTRGHNILEMMDSYEGSWEKVTAPDGGVYAFPSGGLTGIFPNAYAMRHWIHSDFLDKYEEATGEGIPTTTDEYYEYLVWCRDNDVNENGNAADEVGWAGAEDRSVWYARPTDFLMNAFSFQNQDGYYQREDVIHAAFVEDDYRDGLRYLNMLMDEGLMDENYATNDENQLKSLVALEDGYTVASGSWGGMHNAATDHRIRNLYEIVAPLEGPDGFQNSFYDHYSTGVAPGMASIATTSEKPELAAAWMDANCEDEVTLRARYGAKGEDWEVPPEGTIAVDGGPAIYRDITNQWNVPTKAHWFTASPGSWHKYGSMTSEPQPEFDENGNEIHDLELSLYEAARLYENYVIPCAVPNFFYDLETATKANEWKQSIDDLYRNGVTEYIYGNRDIDDDADWAEFVSQLEEAGLTEYLAAMQAEYDRAWVGTMSPEYTPYPQRT